MSAPAAVFLPFLYPSRLLSRLLRHSGGVHVHTAGHGFPRQPVRRPRCRYKSTLTYTANAARTLLDNEVPTLQSDDAAGTSTTTATTAAASDHRTPPFLDTLTLTLHSGHGGHGCVSFVREKFVAHGPPNGGDGGDGGDVYVTVDPQLSSLHKLSRMRVVKAGKGSNGLGGGMNGARGEDVVVKVPPGTVVRVLDRGDFDRPVVFDDDVQENDGYNDWDGERDGGKEYHDEEDGGQEHEFITRNTHDGRTDADPAAILEEKLKRRRRRNRTPRRFARSNVDDPASVYIHYPLSLARNLDSPHWPPRRQPRRDILQPEVFKLDFSDDALYTTGTDAAGRKTTAPLEPTLLLKGGAGGYGNPNFITKDLRRPMWATKGAAGTAIKIQLELKLLADVGLVGRPNVGKSSLLRCVTGSRARIGNWAFTTLTPNMGTVILDGGLGTGDINIDPTSPSTSTASRERFTIADIPGLVPDAGENKGLGWDFLRHVERARGLVFVIDLSFDPVRQIAGLWRDIASYEAMRHTQRLAAAADEKALREAERIRREDAEDVGVIIRLSEEEELDAVKVAPGISEKPWMVVANKADVPGAEARFRKLREYLDGWEEEGVRRPVGCIAVSALQAGAWGVEEHDRQAEVWRGVIGWFRSLVS
ncbi:hypothetical protein Dda_8900 [Drechslerella dactyloides]|uniref:GTP-binding protein Obg/CgtA n=1 Tax=Drechslerella dactyloides TaxID=74499 RepID=A0AAD6IQ46_DREDA|nr:hypothetical protein Dda_8900 [Drechslerella dactyloides]